MQILAFSTSGAVQSINKKLVSHVTTFFSNEEVDLVDILDFETILYTQDREVQGGIPEAVQIFAEKVDSSELIILSLAEHNGAYTALFKNLFDWLSRVPERKTFGNKPMFLLATSPGARGASTVLDIAKNRFPFNGGDVVETFSLPSFHQNFDESEGVTDPDKKTELESKIEGLKKSLGIS